MRKKETPFGWGLIAMVLVMSIASAVQSCGRDTGPLLVNHPGYGVYRKYCRRCHGDQGNALRASRIAHRRVDLGSAAFHDTTGADEVLTVVSAGKGRMKGYRGRISAADLDSVTAYVLALAEARRAANRP